MISFGKCSTDIRFLSIFDAENGSSPGLSDSQPLNYQSVIVSAGKDLTGSEKSNGNDKENSHNEDGGLAERYMWKTNMLLLLTNELTFLEQIACLLEFLTTALVHFLTMTNSEKLL